MNFFNIILILLILMIAAFLIMRRLKNKQDQEAEEQFTQDDKTYTLERMTAFIKKRLDEITKINLYDISSRIEPIC